nr:hypothetical protein [Lysobacter enzymogenes]
MNQEIGPRGARFFAPVESLQAMVFRPRLYGFCGRAFRPDAFVSDRRDRIEKHRA